MGEWGRGCSYHEFEPVGQGAPQRLYYRTYVRVKGLGRRRGDSCSQDNHTPKVSAQSPPLRFNVLTPSLPEGRGEGYNISLWSDDSHHANELSCRFGPGDTRI